MPILALIAACLDRMSAEHLSPSFVELRIVNVSLADFPLTSSIFAFCLSFSFCT